MAVCSRFHPLVHSLSHLNEALSTHSMLSFLFHVCTQMRGAILESLSQPQHINLSQIHRPANHFILKEHRKLKTALQFCTGAGVSAWLQNSDTPRHAAQKFRKN